MRICGVCGSQLPDETVICPKCGCAVPKHWTPPAPKKPDVPAPLALKLVALLIPIAGIIMGLSWREERPQRARNIFIWALAGLAAEVVLGNLFFS